MEEETSQSAKEGFELSVFVLVVYNQEMSNVAALVGENTSKNRSFSLIWVLIS